MSMLTPKPYQKFTHTTVLDRKFRLEHGLTYAQTEVMSYLVMILTSWKNIIFIDGYFVILTSKIQNDLLLGEKTIEASFTKLKKLGLIETKLVKVPQWKSNENFRGVKITEKGKSYSLSHYKPKVHQEIADLKKENDEFRSQKEQLEEKNRDLELKYKVIEMRIESAENLNEKAIEALEAERKKDEKIALLEKELKETKEKLEIVMKESEQNNQTPQEKNKNLKDFIAKTVKEYAKTGEPISNCVFNKDKWSEETKFYINSYSRLSIYTENGNFVQIAEPKKISNFWKWLFAHQHRVGVVLDTKKSSNISDILPFVGKSIIINDNIYKIHQIKAVVGGAKIKLEDKEGSVITLNNEFGGNIIDVKRFMDWIKSQKTVSS
jgi:hypothetical protein